MPFNESSPKFFTICAACRSDCCSHRLAGRSCSRRYAAIGLSAKLDPMLVARSREARDATILRRNLGWRIAFSRSAVRRHSLPPGGHRRHCRQSHQQKEISPLQIHALLPFRFGRQLPGKGYTFCVCTWKGRGVSALGESCSESHCTPQDSAPNYRNSRFNQLRKR